MAWSLRGDDHGAAVTPPDQVCLPQRLGP